jgi:hypothetical protein
MIRMPRTARLVGFVYVLAVAPLPAFAQTTDRAVPIGRQASAASRHGANSVLNLSQLDGPPPSPSEPPAIEHLTPIHGEFRAVDVMAPGAHFEDDTGELLPVGLTYFGALEQRKFSPAEYQR